MNQNVVYVGIDVDDVSYHGSALGRRWIGTRERYWIFAVVRH